MGKCCVVSKTRDWNLSFLKKAVLGLGSKQHSFTKKIGSDPAFY